VPRRKEKKGVQGGWRRKTDTCGGPKKGKKRGDSAGGRAEKGQGFKSMYSTPIDSQHTEEGKNGREE